MPDKDHSAQPTQPTQPKGRDKDGKLYEPIEIPVPKEDDFEKLVRRAVKRQPSSDAASGSED